MGHVLASRPPCPGIRFHPSDEELFMYYLKRKVTGKSFPYQMMSEVDIYRYAPWDLHAMSCLKTKDLYWYFFCPRVKKYANGARAHRLTEFGYWKSTGNDRIVQHGDRPVGKIKTLVFHRGKPPNGDRTNWVMHEYRLEDQVLADKGICQDSYVICKVYEKSGWGPKNGEHYGAPFVEEEWESDDLETHQGPVQNPDNVVLADNVNGASTSGLAPSSTEQLSNVNGASTPGLAPSSTEQLTNVNDASPPGLAPSSIEQMTVSATDLTPSATTEQTVIETQVAPGGPLVNRLEETPNNDCFKGLENLFDVNGSYSAAHFNLPQWPPYDDTGYIEMNDFFNGPHSSDAFLDWPQQLVDDPLGFIELDDLI